MSTRQARLYRSQVTMFLQRRHAKDSHNALWDYTLNTNLGNVRIKVMDSVTKMQFITVHSSQIWAHKHGFRIDSNGMIMLGSVDAVSLFVDKLIGFRPSPQEKEFIRTELVEKGIVKCSPTQSNVSLRKGTSSKSGRRQSKASKSPSVSHGIDLATFRSSQSTKSTGT